MPISVLRVLVVLALVWVLPANFATAAAVPRLQGDSYLEVSRTSAIVGEYLRFAGWVSASSARTVVLQANNGGKWHVVLRGTTTATGRFTFRAGSRPGDTVYRVRAKATSKDPAAVTIPRLVLTAPQNGDLKLPGGAHVGKTRTAWATFTPVRSGRPVELQVQQGDAWVAVASQPESGTGSVTFTLPTDQAGTFAYRAVATKFHGAEAAVSPIRHFVVDP